MSPSRLTLTAAFAVLATTAGCSHQQKPPSPRPPVAQASSPPRPKVVAAATPAADAPETSKTKEDAAVFFDFDSALIKDDSRRVLQTIAEAVRQRNASLKIEGNCDELGTTEYNLALGEERARAAKEYLVHLGVRSNQIATISFGAQRPRYSGHDDDARAKNRRDDLILR
jgi:peptidoglycan-associated lipoprotein